MGFLENASAAYAKIAKASNTKTPKKAKAKKSKSKTVKGHNAISPTKSDAEWRAEEDARQLSTAKVIEADPARMKAAQAAAKRMAEEKMKEAAAMSVVAGKPRK